MGIDFLGRPFPIEAASGAIGTVVNEEKVRAVTAAPPMIAGIAGIAEIAGICREVVPGLSRDRA